MLVSIIRMSYSLTRTHTLSLGLTLYRRLDEAVLQSRIQRVAHSHLTRSFPAALVQKWSKEVDEWCADPFNEHIVNPFEEPEPDVTIADVRREMLAEETAEVSRGVVPRHEVSASKYLVTGLHLEDQQYVIYHIFAGDAILTSNVDVCSSSVPPPPSKTR